MNKFWLIILSLVILVAFSCRKDSFITAKDARISFSSNPPFFDPVFSSAGSVTELVKIVNTNNQKIRLTTVKLMGGSHSSFHINIDGAAGPEQDNLELAAGDSLYIFVAVQITPGGANLPFVIEDSIQISFNGNQRYIQLQAW